MIGLGIDAVDIDRFRLTMSRHPGIVQRLFTEHEIAYGTRYSDPVPRFAVRFAAKEAVMKALGVGLGAFSFRDIEVKILPGGAPSLLLSGTAEAVAGAKGVRQWQVSLTHTEHSAQAVVAAL